jgi:hypothetical protein
LRGLERAEGLGVAGAAGVSATSDWVSNVGSGKTGFAKKDKAGVGSAGVFKGRGWCSVASRANASGGATEVGKLGIAGALVGEVACEGSGEGAGGAGTRLSPVSFNANRARGQAAIVEIWIRAETRINRPGDNDRIRRILGLLTTTYYRQWQKGQDASSRKLGKITVVV